VAIRTNDQLSPDGVMIYVHWDAMRPGDSVFIPCLNLSNCQKQANVAFKERGWAARYRVEINEHILGLRIWRHT